MRESIGEGRGALPSSFLRDSRQTNEGEPKQQVPRSRAWRALGPHPFDPLSLRASPTKASEHVILSAAGAKDLLSHRCEGHPFEGPLPKDPCRRTPVEGHPFEGPLSKDILSKDLLLVSAARQQVLRSRACRALAQDDNAARSGKERKGKIWVRIAASRYVSRPSRRENAPSATARVSRARTAGAVRRHASSQGVWRTSRASASAPAIGASSVGSAGTTAGKIAPARRAVRRQPPRPTSA